MIEGFGIGFGVALGFWTSGIFFLVFWVAAGTLLDWFSRRK
jgi:hypothetical protein